MKSTINKHWSGGALMAIGLALVLGGIGIAPQVGAERGSGSGGTTTSHESETEIHRSGETTEGTETEVHNSTTEHAAGDDSTGRTSGSTRVRTSDDSRAAELRHETEVEAKQKLEDARHEREAAKEKLTDAKLKVCEARKTNINNRTSRISDRTTKQLTLFTNIADRAKAFYASKGNTLANYDVLVADVAAKKAAAEAAVTTISASKATFTCDGSAPKLAIVEFKTSLESSITALKNYRTAVKNLIVGIKSVNSTSTDDSTKSSTGAAQ